MVQIRKSKLNELSTCKPSGLQEIQRLLHDKATTNEQLC